MTVDPRIATGHRPHCRALQAKSRDLSRQAPGDGQQGVRSARRCPAATWPTAFAACGPGDKANLAGDMVPNLGIITSYNDMLSAHQPFETYPERIRQAARDAGGVAQVAGGRARQCATA